jgi:hypothetical protein
MNDFSPRGLQHSSMCTSASRRPSLQSGDEKSGGFQCHSMKACRAGHPPRSGSNDCGCDDTDDTASMSSVSSGFFSEAQDTTSGFVIAITSADELDECSDNGNPRPNESSGPTSTPKAVKFSTLTIREYQRCLGDNVPSVGAPVTIVWDHHSEAVYSVEDYEIAVAYTRRRQSQLKMPRSLRDEMLQSLGYSRREVQKAANQSLTDRNRRRRTNEMLAMKPMEELIETTRRVGAKAFAPLKMRPLSSFKLSIL